MSKRSYENKDNRKGEEIDSIRAEIEGLKEKKKLLREKIKELEGDPIWPYLTDTLFSVERRIKALQLEEELSKGTSRLPYCLKERTVSDEDTLGFNHRGTETDQCPKSMKIVNEKSRYYGQEVKPLKELNYGGNVVIQVKLENGKTEIFDPEDLTEV